MKGRQSLLAAVALAFGAAPVLAQGNAQAPAAAQDHDMGEMICSMGMLPHPGMSAGRGGMMEHGAMGAGGMQHGAMGQAGQAMGGMQHGAMGQAGAKPGAQPGAQPAHAMDHMGGMAHPVTPTMLIHHAKELGLTEDQQAKVQQLAQTSQASCEQHLEAAAASHKAAVQALGAGTPDVAAYQGSLRQAFEHLLEGHIAVVKAGQEAAALLTPAQREKLAATADSMHGKK